MRLRKPISRSKGNWDQTFSTCKSLILLEWRLRWCLRSRHSLADPLGLEHSRTFTAGGHRPKQQGGFILARWSLTARSAFGLALAALLLLAGLPGTAAAQPREVEVGAFVSSLSDINPSGGSFRVVLYVWFNDPAGRFNVERDLHLVARTASIDAIDTEPAPGGGSYTYARIEAEVPQEFDFRDFPFDRQRLTVRMEASETVEDLHFVPDHEDTDASDYLPMLGWTLDGISIDVQEHAYDSDFGYWTGRGAGYSQIQLSLDISRERSPVLIDDFLGFVFAFMITSLTFLVSATELGLRIGMNTGALFAAVVNLGRLHESAGFRPDFGLVDRLAFLVFGAILCSLIIAITMHRFAKRGDADRVEPDRLRRRRGDGRDLRGAARPDAARVADLSPISRSRAARSALRQRSMSLPSRCRPPSPASAPSTT